MEKYLIPIESLAIRSRVFSHYQSYKPIEMKLADASFPGFREALDLLPVGAKAKFVIPSNLAYGSYGSNKDIPAYTPLICEFEILK